MSSIKIIPENADLFLNKFRKLRFCTFNQDEIDNSRHLLQTKKQKYLSERPPLYQLIIILETFEV